MGDSMVSLLDSFALAHGPVPDSLRVYVNGVASQNFTYDPLTRSVRFDPSNLPSVGAEIKVYYLKE
jgi:hypothetical protein